MKIVMVSFVLAALMVCSINAGEDGCPCVVAAVELGVKGDQLAALTKLRDTCMAEMAVISNGQNATECSTKCASGTKSSEELSAAQAKQKELLKPALSKFHAGVKSLLGADVYAKYNAKLPAFLKA